jgi:hypothetical protein
VNCPVCQRETSPVKIGGQIYCSVCGTAKTTDAPAARRVSLDLSPRSRTNVKPAAASSEPPSVHHGLHTAPGAGALHGRTKPGRVLDLRGAAATHHLASPEPVVHHPAHHEPAPPPNTAIHERHQAHFDDRLARAKQVERSPHIGKFVGGRVVETNTPPSPVAAHHPSYHEAPMPELPHLAATHHQAMTRLTPTPPPASAVAAPSSPTWRPHLSLNAGRSRVAATVVAIIIMGGYVWLQNYPKFALQGANSRAGVAASLPGYLPSSYSLASTKASPGLVTLDFRSPSTSETLKIEQHRTTWDSNSLLDNFVAKNSDDYATMQGQGLTIYLFNDNRATWVNKGIWFSIEGSGHLSREQILKMVYSL